MDLRHLNLVADVMTRTGSFTAFSRGGGLATNPSPFLKMSFETTTKFLCEAVLDGDRDDLNSPSARLVVGALGRVGTGGVGVFLPVVAAAGDQPNNNSHQAEGEGEGEGEVDEVMDEG